MDDKQVSKLFTKLKKEMKKEDGSFVLQLGKKRKFPTPFSEVSESNYLILRELYKQALEASLNGYTKNHFHAAERSIIQIVKYFDLVVEFVFGSEEHMGVYPIVLRTYKEKFQKDSDISELLPAVEALFVQGYRVQDLHGEYYLLTPSLGIEKKLEKQKAKAHVRHYDYMGALRRLVKISPSAELTEDEKVALLSFELAADAEKAIFSAPFNFNNTLHTLTDLQVEDEFDLYTTKISETHATSIFRGEKLYGINTSFIGKSKRNYFWIVADYTEHRLIEDLNTKFGFGFIKNLPTKYIVDHEGYLVSKMTTSSSDLVLNLMNYYPANLRTALTFAKTMSNETKEQVRGELSTYVLLQMALGNDVLDENSFQIDEDMRILFNYHHSGRSLMAGYAYPSLPNNVLKLTIDTSMTLALEYSEIRRVLEDFIRDSALPKSQYKFFGSKNGISFKNEALLEDSADKLEINNLPTEIFELESGVLTEIGVKIYKKEEGLYDNWFANHLKTSGMPEYSEPFYIMCNRFALLALASAHINGKLS